ncbi:MAG: GxxExxY protein [Candidatus Competibacteraceae bacterium]|nr:GxxExxY protein [Candidatus Competibacteraceae bacterium]
MSRDWLLYLGDLIESGEKIERFVTGRTFDTFVADEAIFDAVLFNLQVIGEATKANPKSQLTRTGWFPGSGLSGGARARIRQPSTTVRPRSGTTRIAGTTPCADFVCLMKSSELKALDRLTTREESQLINYLKASGKERGLLLNFGARSLEQKRMILSKNLRESA